MNQIPMNLRYKMDRFLVRVVNSMGFGSCVAGKEKRLKEFDEIHTTSKKSVVSALNAFLYTDYNYYIDRERTDMSHIRRALKNLKYVDRIDHVLKSEYFVKATLIRTPKDSSMFNEFSGGLEITVGLKDYKFVLLKEKI